MSKALGWRRARHVNLVGSHTPKTREADGDTLARARVFTEITSFAMQESGDILLAIEEGKLSEAELCGEIGALIDGRIDGRRDEHEITLYVSLGKHRPGPGRGTIRLRSA